MGTEGHSGVDQAIKIAGRAGLPAMRSGSTSSAPVEKPSARPTDR